MARSGVSRSLILDAAREELGTHGFSGARVARIAKRAGVNKQLIFYYFGSKQGLHDEVARVAAAASGREEGSDRGGPGQLRAVLNQLHDFLSSHPEVVAMLVEHGRATGPTETLRVAVEDLVSPVRHAIAKGQGLGHYRDDANADLAGYQALALCVGYLALRDVWAGPMSAPVAWASATRDLFARGLAW